MALYVNATNEFKAGNLEDCIKLNEKAIILGQSDESVAWKDIAAVQLNLSHIYKLVSEFDSAREVAEKALASLDAHFSSSKAEVCHALDVVAELCCELDDYPAATDYVARCIDIKSRMYGASGLPLAKSYNIRAAIHMRENRLEQARLDFIRALAINVRSHGRSYPLSVPVAITLSNIAGLVPESASRADIYMRVLEAFEAAPGTDNWIAGSAMTDLADALISLNRIAEAKQLLTRALHIFLSTRGLDHPSTHRATALLKVASQSCNTDTADTQSCNTADTQATNTASSYTEECIDECEKVLLPKETGRVTGDVVFMDQRGHVGHGHPHTPLV